MKKKNFKKKKLGKIRNGDYKYKTSLDLTGDDLLAQIEQWDEEEKIVLEIEKEIQEIEKIAGNFKEKLRNLRYYYLIGKKLQFVEKPIFKGVAPHSIFRVLYEFYPSLLPGVTSLNVGPKHIRGMFYLGKVSKSDLPRATWSQWYEISKFPALFTSHKLYRKVLGKLESKKLSGPELRGEIKNIIDKDAKGRQK